MKTIKEQLINVYGLGIVNAIEDTLIKDGAASESQNFLTLRDRIELIKGRRILGAEEVTNDGVLGMGKIQNIDGSETLFRKIGTTLEYFNNTTQLWIAAKTGLLADEPLYFANSFTPAGRQVWACGQDGLFKIYPSSPTSVLDMTSDTKNYKGPILIARSRMLCWGMKEDPTGLRFSKIDKDANYTLISGEVVSSATASHYTGTLLHGQVFGAVFTKGGETLTDDKNGNLTGDGTGTINYATGDYVLDFTTSNATAVTASYLYEDSLVNGLADFTYSSPRLAGEGNVLRQDSIGTKTQIVVNFNDTFYSLQDRGSWSVKISTDDLTFDNQIYRSNVGCPSVRGAVVSANGIIFVDVYDPDVPKLRLLTFNKLGDKIIPILLSENFKLEEYSFDADTLLYIKGDFVFICCKLPTDTNNSTMLIFNSKQWSFDLVYYEANEIVELNNKVIAGDSRSPNTYELFTGLDDLDYEITAFWSGKKNKLRTESLKKVKKMRFSGYIDIEQIVEVYASYDNEAYSLLGYIEGTGEYVDENNAHLIGEPILGDEILGLADSSAARYYETEIKIRTPKFKYVKLKFVPTKIGYFSVLDQKFSDIRIKSSKIPRKYKRGTGSGVGYSRINDAFVVN